MNLLSDESNISELTKILNRTSSATLDEMMLLNESPLLPLELFRKFVSRAKDADLAGDYERALTNRNLARTVLPDVEAWEASISAALEALQIVSGRSALEASFNELRLVWERKRELLRSNENLGSGTPNSVNSDWEEKCANYLVAAQAALIAVSAYPHLKVNGFTLSHYQILVKPWESLHGRFLSHDNLELNKNQYLLEGFNIEEDLKHIPRGAIPPTGLVEGKVWRDGRAIKILGHYDVKTAGGFMQPSRRVVIDGWIYANTKLLLFISNLPLDTNPALTSISIDDCTLLLSLPGRKVQLSTPFGTPNGIMDFGDGIMFVGAKKQIKAIGKYC